MKTLHYITTNEKKALLEIKKLINKTFKNSKIYIYGSKVRGTFDEESDLDILVVIPVVNWKIKKKIINFITEINLKYSTNISPIIVSLDEWENKPFLPLFQEIRKEGIQIE
jgi:hypothetical protein